MIHSFNRIIPCTKTPQFQTVLHGASGRIHPIVDYDEEFVSPCVLNEVNCGGFMGKWTPRISFIGMTINDV